MTIFSYICLYIDTRPIVLAYMEWETFYEVLLLVLILYYAYSGFRAFVRHQDLGKGKKAYHLIPDRQP